MRIDKRAIVSHDAELADDVTVGSFTIIEPDVHIDSGTSIASNVLIAQGSRVGKNCHIFHGAVIGTIPQDLKFKGEYTTVHIEDKTIVREYCTINRGTAESEKTIVGSQCLLMAYVHIAHDCVIGNNVILANAVNMAGHVSIDDYATVGGMVPIHQFVHIGKHSFIGGGFRVDKDVPPYILAAGNPLKYTGLNSIGLRRRQFSKETMAQIKSAYKVIYHSNMNTSQAIEQVKSDGKQTPEINEICQFIENSSRGII